jgi:hypothetical protein
MRAATMPARGQGWLCRLLASALPADYPADVQNAIAAQSGPLLAIEPAHRGVLERFLSVRQRTPAKQPATLRVAGGGNTLIPIPRVDEVTGVGQAAPPGPRRTRLPW